MGATDEALPAPAIAPVYSNNLVHNRYYGLDGEIMAFIIIFVFSVFLVFLVFAPYLMMLRKSNRDSSPVEQNIGNA
ncbi:hypothetical protein Hanom_Chr08g00753811 [Helianthus anomalus]